MFIKDLAMAAFGPEVLGASTIYGTKKGGSRSKKEGETPKPGLDKRILKAVRGKILSLEFIVSYVSHELIFQLLIVCFLQKSL